MNNYHEAFAAYITKTDHVSDLTRETEANGTQPGSKNDSSVFINCEDVIEENTRDNTVDKVGCGKSECNEQATIKSYHDWRTVKEVESNENNKSEITDDTIFKVEGSRLTQGICQDNLKVEEKIQQYKCKLCEYKAKDKYYLVRHFRRMHDENIELFPCDLCEYKSKYKQVLKRHKDRIHRGISPWYHCQFCDLKTKCERSLQNHLKLRHSEDSEQLHCHLCGRTFKTKSGLSYHISYKHSKNAVVYQCFHCEYTCKIKTNLRDHISHKHNKNIEVRHCLHCEYRSNFKSKLKRHIARVHNEKGDLEQCHPHKPEDKSDLNKANIYKLDFEFCDFKAKSKPCLVIDEKSRHKEISEWHQCRFCDQRYKSKDTLKKHISYKHNESAPFYQCPYCEYTSKIKNVLSQHINNRHNENAVLYECSRCQHKSKSEHRLLHHIKNVHNENVEWCQCEFCYFRTKSKYTLRKHFERKHNGKISTTDGSSSEHSQQIISTSNSSSKLMNMKDHKDNKSEGNNEVNINATTDDQLDNENGVLYPCAHCEYKSKNEDNLKDHITSIHNENVEWYQCQFCCFRTKFKYGLRKHFLARHNVKSEKNIKSKCDDDMVYPCSHCEYKSKSEDDLKDHINNIHNDNVKWYKCEFCFFTTKLYYGLSKHLGKKHIGEISTISRNSGDLQQTTLSTNSTSSKLINVKDEKNIENEYDVNTNITNNQPEQKTDVLDCLKLEIDVNDLSIDVVEKIKTEDSNQK